MHLFEILRQPVKRSVLGLATILIVISITSTTYVFIQGNRSHASREKAALFHLGAVNQLLEADKGLEEIHHLLESKIAQNTPSSSKAQASFDSLAKKISDNFYLSRGHLETVQAIHERFVNPKFDESLSYLNKSFNKFSGDFEAFANRQTSSNTVSLMASLVSLRTRLLQLHDHHLSDNAQLTRSLADSENRDLRNLLIATVLLTVFALAITAAGIRHIEANTRRENQVIEKSRDGLKAAQNIAHVGSWEWNIVTNELAWSDEIYRIFGQEPQSFLPTYGAFLEVIHPDDRDAVSAAVEATVTKMVEYDIEHRIVLPTGEIRIVQEQGVVKRSDSGEPLEMIGAVFDITDHKAAETALRDLNESLEQRVVERTAELRGALDDLKLTQRSLVEAEKMASLGGLVAGIAHEVNTPVGIGVTAASHLRELTEGMAESFKAGQMKRSDLESFMKTASEACEILETNLMRASELISSFKKVAVDQTYDSKRLFGLGVYLEEVLKSLRPKLKNTQHQIDLNIDPDLAVNTYPGAISQIFSNLVTNSLVHAFNDGEKGNIRVTVEEKGKDVILSYSDNGNGMDETSVRKVFEPFFTTKRGTGGSGLGMHILYNLVTQSLGGQVTCQSKLGEGTRFQIVFPQNLAESQILDTPSNMKGSLSHV